METINPSFKINQDVAFQGRLFTILEIDREKGTATVLNGAGTVIRNVLLQILTPV